MYVYNSSLLLEMAVEGDAQKRRRYEQLLAGVDVSFLPRRDQRESMYPEALLHRQFARSPRAVLTDNTSDADILWVPLWPYAACTARWDGVSRTSAITHLHQVVYGTCKTVLRIYEWVRRQEPWKRAHGADHVFFLVFKDYIYRYRHYFPPEAQLVLANAVFATTEDRLPAPERRLGCTSVVMPYYASAAKWTGDARFDELVTRKSRLLAFFGNTRGYSCHLVHSTPQGNACPHTYNANRVRSAIGAAVRAANGTFHDLHRRPQSTFGNHEVDTLRDALFCPHAAGDVYTSPRLYTAILALCIPVIISDRVQLPFTATLDWDSFSLRFNESTVVAAGGSSALIALLRAVPPARVAEMQRQLWLVRRTVAFTESPAPGGNDAMGMLTDELSRAVSCERPVLVQLLANATHPCIHGFTFGMQPRVQSGVQVRTEMWARDGCVGEFARSGCLLHRKRYAGAPCRTVVCGSPSRATLCELPAW